MSDARWLFEHVEHGHVRHFGAEVQPLGVCLTLAITEDIPLLLVHPRADPDSIDAATWMSILQILAAYRDGDRHGWQSAEHGDWAHLWPLSALVPAVNDLERELAARAQPVHNASSPQVTDPASHTQSDAHREIRP